MAKAKTAAAVQFCCTECGYSAGRWFGKCPGCAAFGTLVEEIVGQVSGASVPPKPLLRLVDVQVEEAARIPTGVSELDRVLGYEAAYAGPSFLAPGDLGSLRYGSELMNVTADPTTPGGLDSVSIIALGSGSNVPLIIAIQTLRLFAVVASGSPLAKLIGRLA